MKSQGSSGSPVDVLVIKKIGVPGNEEMAAGATGIDEFILNEAVSAVAPGGGRPDLTVDHLSQVMAPTLLIVGGDDLHVLGLNRIALERLQCEKRLEIVPGASHLFEEPGKLGEASHLVAEWFIRHLGR